MIRALPAWLLSSWMIFLSIPKDSFSVFCLLWVLTYVVFSVWNVILSFCLLMWISMLWVESYRNSYSISFGKREIYWKQTPVSHITVLRAGLIQALGATGTRTEMLPRFPLCLCLYLHASLISTLFSPPATSFLTFREQSHKNVQSLLRTLTVLPPERHWFSSLRFSSLKCLILDQMPMPTLISSVRELSSHKTDVAA